MLTFDRFEYPFQIKNNRSETVQTRIATNLYLDSQLVRIKINYNDQLILKNKYLTVVVLTWRLTVNHYNLHLQSLH